MSINITNILDHEQNQSINFVLDPRETNPLNGKKGQLYFNTIQNKIFWFDGTIWRSDDLTNIISENSSISIEIINGVANLIVNVDNETIENAVNGQLRIKDDGVSTVKIQNNAVTTVKIIDKAITFQKIQDIPTMTVIGNITENDGSPSSIQIINEDDFGSASDTNIATAGSIKAYIDSRLVGIGKLIGSYNADTETTFPGDENTNAGDYWYVTVGGTINGVPFNPGDVIIASKSDPNTNDPNDYIFLETNRDQATTTVLGLVMLATNEETQTGTNTTKVVTPASLSSRTATETRTGLARIATEQEAQDGINDTAIMTPAKVKLLIDESGNGGFTTLIGNGTLTEIEINHPLNTKTIIAEFYDDVTNKKVLVDYAPISNSVVQASFSNPPALNKYRVVILKG